MSNLFVKIKQFILLMGDIALFYLSLGLTLLIRYQTPFPRDSHEHLAAFSIIYLCLFFVFYINELYDLEVAKNDLQFLKKISESMIIAFVIAVAFFYLTPFFGIAPKTNLFLNLGILAGLIIAWRLAFNHLFRGKLLGTKVLLIGLSEEMSELEKIIIKRPFLGFEAVRLNGAISLAEFVRTNAINIVVIDKTAKGDPTVTAALYNLISSSVHVTDCLTFYEEVMTRIPISILDEIWFVENFKETRKKLYDEVKTVADFVLALLLATPLLVISLLIGAAIKLDDNGPIFYRQKRVGRNGKIFSITKFRTMAINAENMGAQFASIDDPRVTTVGRILRKFRIDELPQIFNILAGQMSFIGPRPERPEFTKELEAAFPFYPLRYLIKPGLTGWAQIKFSYGATIEENLKKLQYDFYYIKHRSFILDAVIILRTFNLLIHPKGR